MEVAYRYRDRHADRPSRALTALQEINPFRYHKYSLELTAYRDHYSTGSDTACRIRAFQRKRLKRTLLTTSRAARRAQNNGIRGP